MNEYGEFDDIPPSQIKDQDKYPSLHVISCISTDSVREHLTAQVLNHTQDSLVDARAVIVNRLTEICYGDEIVAEYILMTLLSEVHSHADGSPLGNLGLNVYSPNDDKTQTSV